jgi:hypothetical protein
VNWIRPSGILDRSADAAVWCPSLDVDT